LFFGALLGANLGTIQNLKLSSYLIIVALLAGTVMALRMVSTGEAQRKVLLLLAAYVVLLTSVLFVPELRPRGLSVNDVNRLVTTMMVWIGIALAVELSPTAKQAENFAAEENTQEIR
jgi:hypothetical protein